MYDLQKIYKAAVLARINKVNKNYTNFKIFTYITQMIIAGCIMLLLLGSVTKPFALLITSLLSIGSIILLSYISASALKTTQETRNSLKSFMEKLNC